MSEYIWVLYEAHPETGEVTLWGSADNIEAACHWAELEDARGARCVPLNGTWTEVDGPYGPRIAG